MTHRVLDKNSDRFLRGEKVGRESLLRRPLKPLLSFYVFPNRSNLDLFISHQLLRFSEYKQYFFSVCEDRVFAKRERKWGANRKLALINKVISYWFLLGSLSSAIRSQDIIDRITIFTAFGYKQVHGNSYSYLCNKGVK